MKKRNERVPTILPINTELEIFLSVTGDIGSDTFESVVGVLAVEQVYYYYIRGTDSKIYSCYTIALSPCPSSSSQFFNVCLPEDEKGGTRRKTSRKSLGMIL